MGYERGDILVTEGYGTLYYISDHDDEMFFGTDDIDECREGMGHYYHLSIIEYVDGNIFEEVNE